MPNQTFERPIDVFGPGYGSGDHAVLFESLDKWL
jgi:hypothetical protein